MRWLAPGKLVIVGEYAVLEGAPAVVAAVDHGVTCTVTSASRRTWWVPGDDDRFVAAALTAAAAPPALYRFADHRPSPDPTQKPGFGGSAAATVAAFAAAWGAAGRPVDAGTLHPLAAAVHRSVQGSGSGIDVAAAAYGGFLRFEDGSCRPTPPAPLVVVWSGRQARTGPRLAAWSALRGPIRDTFVVESALVADRWPGDPGGALNEAGRLLAAMTRAAGIDWQTPEHAAIAAWAREAGGCAKPSGAGGGDCAVAWFPDPDRAAAFRARVTAPCAVVDVRWCGGVARHDDPASEPGPQLSDREG